MKINGTAVQPHGLRVLTLPRIDGQGNEYLVTFQARPADLARFAELCPPPKAPPAVTRSGFVPEDTTDPRYLAALKSRRKTEWAFMIIDSLEPSNIEWETVKTDDPATWLGYETELKSLFTAKEFDRIITLVARANALDDSYLDRANEFFFRSMAARHQNENCPLSESGNSEYGARAEHSE